MRPYSQLSVCIYRLRKWNSSGDGTLGDSIPSYWSKKKLHVTCYCVGRSADALKNSSKAPLYDILAPAVQALWDWNIVEALPTAGMGTSARRKALRELYKRQQPVTYDGSTRYTRSETAQVLGCTAVYTQHGHTKISQRAMKPAQVKQ